MTRPGGRSPVAVLTEALGGAACAVHGLHRTPEPLPMRAWQRDATVTDRGVLAHCRGATLDVGCGPGRMAEGLALRGVPVMGIDVVPAAVAETRARGVPALVRDVFDPLPAEGRWRTVLLADGNIGIGGDPARLLLRVAGLLADGGRVVLDVQPPGTGLRTHRLQLSSAAGRSTPFLWAQVGVDAVGALAVGCGLRVVVLDRLGERWFAVLERRR